MIVLKQLKKLDLNKASGPNGISARLLKDTAEQIAPSLTSLFNMSLYQGEVPEDWKLANIVPIYRKGTKTFVENYRPISLLPILSKVIERCVLAGIKEHVFRLINSAQHGFQPGRSCVAQLTSVLDYIGSQLRKQTDIIYLDMSKAFDKVNHTLLLDKLRRFNISGTLLNWFSSYLRGRRQRVTVLGATSRELPVTSGVPQGSILGPILFLLFVNELPDVATSSTVACFADDTKLYKRVDHVDDATALQSNLSKLVVWSETSGMKFNRTKCVSQRITHKMNPVRYPYTIEETSLRCSETEKYERESRFVWTASCWLASKRKLLLYDASNWLIARISPTI